MLYLWPYMLFFSSPIALYPLLDVLTTFSSHGIRGVSKKLPRFHVLLMASLCAVATIHYNTIVHPFTLADNRHYVFYVFRILLRHPAIKYLAAPVYVLCGYIIIQTLGNANIPEVKPATVKKSKDVVPLPTSTKGNRASFVLVWLATTTLSLVTAPLVEPRYCIIPWIMWRLQVPNHSTSSKAAAWWQSGLMLETVWFCLINFGTGYLFLHRGFAWEQEPGNVQRFMW
jgi:alpha-1,2-glucosyltransferase